jgi:Ulp1 protease family, C-terminal catalytic domain
MTALLHFTRNMPAVQVVDPDLLNDWLCPRPGFGVTLQIPRLRYAPVRSNPHEGEIRPIVLIPFNLGDHWILVVLDYDSRKIHVFDSLGGKHTQAVASIQKWLDQILTPA